jgi:two-component system CheB/CheR fusion protein
MGEVLAQARQDRGQVTLALLDLDGFKQINDSLGHAAGDLVIRDVAQALTGAISTNQFLFRWGGDEFALVFPELDRKQSYQVLVSYQAALAQASPPGFSLTASLGLATFPEDGLMLEELFQKADAEMYQEKLSRNPPDTPLG